MDNQRAAQMSHDDVTSLYNLQSLSSLIPAITADIDQQLISDACDVKPDLLYILKTNIRLESRAYQVVFVEMIISWLCVCKHCSKLRFILTT